MTRGGDLQMLRGINERALLTYLRAGGAWRASELADQTGLTRASVITVLSALIQKGWVLVESTTTEGRGRPARLYRFHGDAGFVLGIDIGAHVVRARVATLDGRALASIELDVRPSTPRQGRLDSVQRAADLCLEAANIDRDQVWVSLAGTTGIVDLDSGAVVESAAIADWQGLNLRGELSKRLPGTVFVDHDMTLSAIAEIEQGAGAGADDVLIFHAGNRLGIRVFIDGQPLEGFHRVSGDISRYRLPEAGARSWFDPSLEGEMPDIRSLAERVHAGDSQARDELRNIASHLGDIAAVAAAVVDPQLVIVTGPLAAHADIVVSTFLDRIERLCLRPPEVVVSTLGAESVVAGAVRAALRRVEDLLLDEEDRSVPRLEMPS